VTILVGGAGLERHHPALEMILLLFGAGFPALLILILVAVILFGSKEKLDRAFRLLRWLRDKPEPPGPPGAEIPDDSTKDPEVCKPDPAELPRIQPGAVLSKRDQAARRRAPLPACPSDPADHPVVDRVPASLRHRGVSGARPPERPVLSRTLGLCPELAVLDLLWGL
jgi:hypothetical protein